MSHPHDPISTRLTDDFADSDEEIELEPTIHQPAVAAGFRGRA